MLLHIGNRKGTKDGRGYPALSTRDFVVNNASPWRRTRRSESWQSVRSGWPLAISLSSFSSLSPCASFFCLLVPLSFARSPLFPLTPSLSLSLQNLSRINWFDPDVSSREIPIGHRIVTPLALFALSLAFLPRFPLLYALQDQDNPFSPGSPEIPNIHQSYVIERFRRPCKSSSRELSWKERASWSFNESLQGYTSEIATAIESISLSKDISAIIIEWGNQTLNVSF